MKPYPQYRDSGIEWLGEIPAQWETKRVKFAAKEPLKYGANESAEVSDRTLPRFIRITDIAEDGTLREDTFKSLPEQEAEPFLLKQGDVLLARSGATVGKSFMYNESWGRACYAGYLIRLRLHPTKAIPEFFTYFANSSVYWQWLSTVFIQATIQNVSAEKYANLQLPLPSVPEQRAIAKFLDRETARVDAMVAKKERLIELLLEKRTALISHAVTKGLNPNAPMKDSGVDWLGQVPAHWEVKRIAMAAKKITNGFVGPTRDILVDEGVRYLQSLHIKNGEIRFEKPYFVTEAWSKAHSKSILFEGDVLIVQTGDIGQCCAVSKEFVGCNCHALIIVQLKDGLGSGFFLSSYLRSDAGRNELQRAQTGALHPHLECGKVREIRIPLPPVDEQNRIVAFIDRETTKLDDLTAKVRDGIEKLKEYRTALITAAVTGKIDVRG